MYSFSYLEPVCCSMSSSNCCFLTCIQVSQEAGQFSSVQLSRSVVSDSVWPHRRQSTRFPIPGILQSRTLEWAAIYFSNVWKGKVKVKSLSRVDKLLFLDLHTDFSRGRSGGLVFSSLEEFSRPHGLQPTRLLHPWDFPDKSTGVGCHCLLLLKLAQHYKLNMLC